MPPGIARSLLCVASLVVGAAQAGTAQQAGGARAQVRGIVFDSLRMRPVAGASVWSPSASRATISDSLGRFVLDSLPAGELLLVAADPALDSLGIQASGRVVAGAEGEMSSVVLSTPGLATLASRLCGVGTELPEGSGIIFGSVRDAANGALVSGALVNVTWLSVTVEGDRVTPGIAAARPRTDSIGTFAHCGVPVDTALEVTAYAGPLGSSGAIYPTIGEPRALRADLFVARESASDAAGTVRGVVTDSAHGPMESVQVSVEGTTRETRTNSRGEFLLRGAPTGTRTLIVRRPGFAPAYVAAALTATDTPYVYIVMNNARLLSTVEIRAERMSRTMADISSRMRLGLGHHRTAEQLKFEPSFSALFRSIPGLRVAPGRAVMDNVLIGRTLGGADCVMSVFIDGVKGDTEMLSLFQVQALTAVEIYPRANQVPPQYQSRTNGCGAVLVWTSLL